ncbi:MAG: carboxymuconolactone decarboxylase family protein [Flavobacteriales bacterium]|jgi:uncharacterized peroxidase-related enzyme|nr:carboxymuconolactone decarboxylase family protein [Flavobacteriales bacterium]
MTNFNVPKKEEVSETNQIIFDNLNKTLGFVPNLYAAMAHSENGLKKYLEFQNTKSSFSNKEKEVINLVVSQINECKYCQSAHTVLGKMNGFSDEEIIGFRLAKSSNTKLQSLVEITSAITRQKGKIDHQLVESFYTQGYTKENLVDLILQISDKIAMNYLHNLTQVEIDFPLAKEL